jgi:four helix bundle protein
MAASAHYFHTSLTMPVLSLDSTGIDACRTDRMRHDNLRDRTFNFAGVTIKAVRPLINGPLGRHLVGQRIRSSAAVASNYRSACHARSRRDFASKISIVAEEAAETSVWLRLFVAVELMNDAVAQPLVVEGEELTAIAIASAQTARKPKK